MSKPGTATATATATAKAKATKKRPHPTEREWRDVPVWARAVVMRDLFQLGAAARIKSKVLGSELERVGFFERADAYVTAVGVLTRALAAKKRTGR